MKPSLANLDGELGDKQAFDGEKGCQFRIVSPKNAFVIAAAIAIAANDSEDFLRFLCASAV